MSFVNSDTCVSYVPEFVAKTESFSNNLPHSFLVKSLSEFAAGLEEDLLLCLFRALRIHLHRTRSFFLSSALPLRLSSPSLSFPFQECCLIFLREAIHDAGAAMPEVDSVHAHSIRGVSASAAFHRN